MRSTHYSPQSEPTSPKQPGYDIYTLPLEIWIDFNVTGNPEILPNWEQIFEQYCDLTGDKTANEMFITEKQVVRLRQKIYIMKLIVAQLSVEYKQELADILRNDFFYFWNGDLQLESVLEWLKTDEVALEIAEADMAKLQASDSNKATKFDYLSNISELSKFQGWRIDAKICTLAEYIAISNRYSKHIEFLKKNPGAAVRM